MSEPEGRSHSPTVSEEEGTDERATPIAALAPDADAHYEQPAVISSNPALQFLDQLFSEGKISGAKMAYLKASFNRLHEALRSSQESEMQLLQEVKAKQAKLEEQKEELEKPEMFIEGHETEASKLKQKLLHLNNELKESEERDGQMQFQIECLKEEKLYLEKEYQNQPKPDELEKRYLSLKESCEETRKETIQLRQEVKTLAENLEIQQKHTDNERCELDELKELVETKEAELAQVLLIPVHLGREINRIIHKKSELEKQVAMMEEQRLNLMEQRQKMEAKCEQVKETKKELLRELDAYKAQLMAAENKQERLAKEPKITKAKEAIFMDQRGLLDIHMEETVAECKSLRNKLARDTRVKDRLVRDLKLNELQLKHARDTLIQTQQQHDRTKAQRDAVPDGDCLLQKRKDLEKEVEDLKCKSMAGLNVQSAEDNLKEEQALIQESRHCREELCDLHRLILIKADEREKKSHELLKVQLKNKLYNQDLQGKDLVIQEHKKHLQETQSRLNLCAKLYEVAEAERNKYMSLIQISNQNLEKVQEKLDKLKKDVQTLQTTAFNKDMILQRSRLQHSECYKRRDHTKNEISKVSLDLQEMHQKREEQKLHIGSLVHTINTQEQNLLHLRKSYKAAVHARNEWSMQLVEREREMSIFEERLKKLECGIHDDNMKIYEKEDEIRDLKILHKEEERQINMQRQQLQCIPALQEEFSVLQIGLSQSKEKLKELEKAAVDHGRAKELDGTDPSHEELVKKLEQLEVKLVDKEAHLLEMELVHKQVTHLTQRVQTKVENGKEDALYLAKKVNKLQDQIRKCTHKTMAVVAELSMQKAKSMTFQREVEEKKVQLDSCQRRLDQGLPPSDDIEHEWLRHLRNQQRRQADAENNARLAEEDEWKQLPNGVYTTAELRPNAYVPADDPLPVPKHYGALAPFKPTEPGANIRHIRKPKPKPIEI